MVLLLSSMRMVLGFMAAFSFGSWNESRLCDKFHTEIRISWCIQYYYAVKKVFVNFSQSFSKFLRSFSKFSQVVWGFRELFEAFGSIRTHWDAFGCIRKQLEAFGRFRKFLRFIGFLSRFSTFPDLIFTKDFFHSTIKSIWGGNTSLKCYGQKEIQYIKAVQSIKTNLKCQNQSGEEKLV